MPLVFPSLLLVALLASGGTWAQDSECSRFSYCFACSKASNCSWAIRPDGEPDAYVNSMIGRCVPTVMIPLNLKAEEFVVPEAKCAEQSVCEGAGAGDCIGCDQANKENPGASCVWGGGRCTIENDPVCEDGGCVPADECGYCHNY